MPQPNHLLGKYFFYAQGIEKVLGQGIEKVLSR